MCVCVGDRTRDASLKNKILSPRYNRNMHSICMALRVQIIVLLLKTNVATFLRFKNVLRETGASNGILSWDIFVFFMSMK
jgi:hypothetical protein